MYWFCIFILLFLHSCAPKPTLAVNTFHLQDVSLLPKNTGLLRSSQLKHLYGSMTLEERNLKRGQYYHITWHHTPTSQQARSLVFEYQQSATGSKKLTQSISLPSDANVSEGNANFTINGKDYQNNGRVLSWRIQLLQGKQVIASKQSYLWK